MTVGEIFRRLSEKDDSVPWREHVAMVWRLHRWDQSLKHSHAFTFTRGDTVAYVANFSRPQNIELIVRSLLACPAISRIIVSNNNPDCHLDEWFRPTSNRVVVMDHSAVQSCAQRFVHLTAFPSPYYLILDDDIFLAPYQINELLKKLHAQPSVPHGVFGQEWDGQQFHMGRQRANRTIDVLNRVYAFTSQHLASSLQSMADVSSGGILTERELSWCDDIMLSHNAGAKPHMHNIGFLVSCPTQGKKGTATWREDGFFESRIRLYKYLLSNSGLTSPA